jgi:thiamine pyrophosphokinase
MKLIKRTPSPEKEGCFDMSSKMHRVVLFANGDLPNPEGFRDQLQKEDIFIAVDGGLDHLIALGLTPRLIIGDLDSANPEDVERFQAQGVELRKFPVDKDETDLELALEAAIEMEPTSIWVAGALGKRLDQTLGSIFLLSQPQLAGMDVRLVDGTCEVFLIHSSTRITGIPGQRVSLIPLNGPAEGVHTKGLRYPLNGETLFAHQTRGISNVLTSSSAVVSLVQGTLICIHQTIQPTERSG